MLPRFSLGKKNGPEAGVGFLFFEHPVLYAMHVNAAFSTDSFAGLYDLCPHCYWDLQKVIVLPQRKLDSIL